MPAALFYDEHELLSQLKAGNKAAFTHLFELYGEPLYLNLLKLLKTEQAAEEILQNIFLIVWKKEKPSQLIVVSRVTRFVSQKIKCMTFSEN